MKSALSNAKKPVLGFAAFSGTGKTTLLRKLLPLLKQRGLRVGMVKHAHHQFDVDKPGKDSYELRKAGADKMLIVSSHRWALMVEKTGEAEAQLNDVLGDLPQDDLDVILVEGFKYETFPKIELHRPSLGHPLLFLDDPNIVAVAIDEAFEAPCSIPILDLNQSEEIADFVEEFLVSDGLTLVKPSQD